MCVYAVVHRLSTHSAGIMAVCIYIHPFFKHTKYSASSTFSLVDSHAEIES